MKHYDMRNKHMKIFGSRSKMKQKAISKQSTSKFRPMNIIMISLFIAGSALVIFAVYNLWDGKREDNAAQTEYANLRELGIKITADLITSQNPQDNSTQQGETPPEAQPGQTQPGQSGTNTSTNTNTSQDASQSAAHAHLIEALSSLAQINPDFIGWIKIPGTTIDFPIVRGANNTQYLTTTFSGTANPAGAIFMDYRNKEDFNAPISILHGHNMRDGNMFSPLADYTDKEFLEAHPEIIIITANGERLVFQIINAQPTDAWDSIYSYNFDNDETAQELLEATGVEAKRLLILSTCIGPRRSDERLLIFAVLN
ncbi:MAG: class B sortase [Oscillospiraceae bacterium]|jgi:SrtB family sortase|nr:class B sortase [Oscillospiraceae bacterium]